VNDRLGTWRAKIGVAEQVLATQRFAAQRADRRRDFLQTLLASLRRDDDLLDGIDRRGLSRSLGRRRKRQKQESVS
jgi:hypothetical protein